MHLSTSTLPTISLNGQGLQWVSQFKYLGHVISDDLSDRNDMRRVKRVLYYGTNMLSAKLGHAHGSILIRLFTVYCAHMYGSELWNVWCNRRPFRELCVAYHSSVKKLLKKPVWTRNHELCHEYGLLPCPMFLVKRQLLFHLRLYLSDNEIVNYLRNSEVGCVGLVAKTHLDIRKRYGLISLNFRGVTKNGICNIFASHLETVLRDRAVQCASSPL